MLGREGNREIRRIVADFMLAFLIVCAVALAVGPGHSRAHAVPLPQIDSHAILEGSSRVSLPAAFTTRTNDYRYQTQTGRERAHVLLSIALAAVVALNLAFWRHLRRAYASPRRNVWRRG